VPHVQRYRAFTLIEMLAVVSIMLILLGVSYAVLSSLAQQRGPEAVVVMVQAMIHNVRDYAAGNGVPARIEFRCTDPNPGSDEQVPSSMMRLQYWSEAFGEWVDVPGRESVPLPKGIYVCKGFPSSLPGPLSVPGDVADLTDKQVEDWQAYEQEVLDEISKYAFPGGSGPELKNEHDTFYIVYGPEGYPLSDSVKLSNLGNMNSSEVVGGTGTSGAPGLTLIRVSGVHVSSYAFYLWNPNTGTRLVFQ